VIGFDTFEIKFAMNRRMLLTLMYILVWQSMVVNSVYDNWPNFNEIVQALMSSGAFVIVSLMTNKQLFNRVPFNFIYKT
jgi:hypothetical protein